MTRLFIDDVSVGMILGIDVYDDTGKIIYMKGQILSNTIISHINSIGYLTLEIENGSLDEYPGEFSKTANLRKSNVFGKSGNVNKVTPLCTTAEMLSPQIEKIFRNHLNNPLMQKMREMAIQSITEFWNNYNQK
ncbi:MAG: hypothetical protein K8S87_12200 [Planctomycetes bacterium]|nr:hypothetical protein [Planctomycetota bacterium]